MKSPRVKTVAAHQFDAPQYIGSGGRRGLCSAMTGARFVTTRSASTARLQALPNAMRVDVPGGGVSLSLRGETRRMAQSLLPSGMVVSSGRRVRPMRGASHSRWRACRRSQCRRHGPGPPAAGEISPILAVSQRTRRRPHHAANRIHRCLGNDGPWHGA